MSRRYIDRDRDHYETRLSDYYTPIPTSSSTVSSRKQQQQRRSRGRRRSSKAAKRQAERERELHERDVVRQLTQLAEGHIDAEVIEDLAEQSGFDLDVAIQALLSMLAVPQEADTSASPPPRTTGYDDGDGEEEDDEAKLDEVEDEEEEEEEEEVEEEVTVRQPSSAALAGLHAEFSTLGAEAVDSVVRDCGGDVKLARATLVHFVEPDEEEMRLAMTPLEGDEASLRAIMREQEERAGRRAATAGAMESLRGLGFGHAGFGGVDKKRHGKKKSKKSKKKTKYVRADLDELARTPSPSVWDQQRTSLADQAKLEILCRAFRDVSEDIVKECFYEQMCNLDYAASILAELFPNSVRVQEFKPRLVSGERVECDVDTTCLDSDITIKPRDTAHLDTAELQELVTRLRSEAQQKHGEASQLRSEYGVQSVNAAQHARALNDQAALMQLELNRRMNPGQRDNEIDVHYLFVREAVRAVRKRLEALHASPVSGRSRGQRRLLVTTGVGHGSEAGPQLLPAIKLFAKQRGFEGHEVQRGQVEIWFD